MNVGKPLDRVDGRAKVTGTATYSAEWALPHLTHAVLVTAERGPARLLALDTQQAQRAPGVVAVLTHHTERPHAQKPPDKPGAPPMALDPVLVLRDETVRYAGQPIAVVVAETLEQARAAAALVKPRYDDQSPRIALEPHLDEAHPPKSIFGAPPDHARGDFARGWAEGEAHVDAVYTTAAESHNPMEPHATTAVFAGGKLTLYDATQYVYGVKRTLAAITGLDPANVRVVCRYVGGGFGSKGLQWPHVTCAALAAMHVGRPVKLVVERRQLFGLVGFRPRTHQRVRLAARRDGSLTAIAHDGANQTSRFSEFTEPVGLLTRILYACPNLAVTHRLVALDTQTPTFQRAPGEASGSFGLECAMDELAHTLALDPLALRLVNYARRDPDQDRPWSSKALEACYQEGARAFGWSARAPKPRATRDGHWWVGQGMATASYPTHRSGASARVRLNADGSARVQIATHDLGTGTYTILTQVAADALGLEPGQITTEIGDTDYPEAPVAGGSQSAASASNAVHVACLAVRDELLRLAVADPASPLYGRAPAGLAVAGGRVYKADQPGVGETMQSVLARAQKPHLEAERSSKPGEETQHYGMHAWGAQFAEVRVDAELGMVRVTRLVGAFAGGRILNPKTARSQLLGGMVMGIGMALLEEVVRDPRQGRVLNGSLEGYMVPVNADVPALEVILVPEDDPHVNPLGIKGLGELGIVGAGAAIANAVFHATGKRVRGLPITLEKLL
ncbi:MAG: acylaldehyde oxidase [Cyanobacteria bacterium RYN_339]|nr:acylaldehyde oxidase [Cyanobacteria bacterium RYN_339]